VLQHSVTWANEGSLSMKYLITIMAVLLILLLVSLWVGHGSYPAKWQLEDEIKAMQQQNEQQRELNRQIRAELEDAQSGNAAVEERARSELGMIRNRETFYEVILDKKEESPRAVLPSENPSTSATE